MNTKEHVALLNTYGAPNYNPVEVVLSKGQGVWVWDVEGKKYFDMMAAYSAINFGHSNPRFIKRAKEQLDQVTMVSRAFMNDQLGPFCKELAELSGTEMVLPMNTGAEAVESAIKCARRWGYRKKGVAQGQAEIVCMTNNFSGRTTTIVGFSTEEAYKDGFGPFTPGFKIATFGDIESLKKLVGSNTVAVLLEPIQGEGGIIIPPDGYLKQVRELCTKENVLLIADEIQSGLCRSGKLFACDHEDVKADIYVIAKSLGAGIVPISAMMSSREIMGVFTHGSHGSTFGGNSLACAVAREVIAYIKDSDPAKNSTELGAYLLEQLKAMNSPYIDDIRGRGLMIGADINPKYGKAKKFCEKLALEGVLCKDTREQTIRFTPPLTVTKEELDWALERLRKVFQS
jgi:ornithine--oxo-acid transaminase